MWPQELEPIHHPDPEVEEALRLLEEKRRKHQHLRTPKIVYFLWAIFALVTMAGVYIFYLHIFHPFPPLTTSEELKEMIARDQALSEAQSAERGAKQAENSATGQSGADGAMSDGYQVGPEGKLLRPDQGNLTPPELPEEAEEDSSEGARAFAKYYFESHIYAWQTGDTSRLKERITPECSDCTNMVEQVEGLYSGGGWTDIQGKTEVVVDEIRANESPRSGQPAFSVHLHFSLPNYKTYRDGSLSTVDSDTQHTVIDCCWVDNQWKACGINAEE